MLRVLIARPSPFARKVRIALREKGLPHEELVDNPWLPDSGVAQRNPLGKVPVLMLEDGRMLHDSSVIIEYLETLPSPLALLPPPGEARVAHRQIEALADGVCDAVVLLVLEGSRSAPSADWSARQMKKIEAGCAALEAALPQPDRLAEPWYVEQCFGLADIAAGCALAYLDLRLPQFDWRPRHPRLAAFSARLEARPAFASTRPEAQEIPAQ